MSIITISRQTCSFGDEIAAGLASKFGWPLLTRQSVLEKFFSEAVTAHDMHMLDESIKYFLKPMVGEVTYLDFLERELHNYVRDNSAVMVGFGSRTLFENEEDALHLRIIAPDKIRVARLKNQYNVSTVEAEQILIKSDRRHKRFVSTLFELDNDDPTLYDIVLNTGTMSIDECIQAVIAAYKEKSQRLSIAKEVEETAIRNNLADLPQLKNPSEIEFANILNMYNIDWIYEPKTFPISWDAEGNVTMAFSPDFYLTKFDTYIELTTMNQKYTSEKKKKVRMVQQLYPGTNIKIVFKKDFHSLIERFKGL